MINSEDNNQKGLIFNIQRFSIHEGPGIRTTVFMKGCPLNCKWCSNPESICSFPEIMVYDIKCIHCEKCREVCPEDAIIAVQGNKRIDFDKCNYCMRCVETCHSKALECVGKYISINDVCEEVEKDSLFYQNSGGGVTLSGGEPLHQWRFVKDLLQKCKELGFHTALDTTGYASWESMEEILRYVDLALFDIKHLDENFHINGTDVSNKQILKNVEKTASMVKTWIRFPVIHGFNDSPDHIEKVALLASRLAVEKVSILPYHEWGKSKYEKLSKDYQFKFTSTISDENIEEIKAVFEDKGIVTGLMS